MDKQITFADVRVIDKLQKLTRRQVQIIQLLEEGYYQKSIAEKLGVSRSYVNQFVRELEKRNLITPNKKQFIYKNKQYNLSFSDPIGNRALTYTITPFLKSLVETNPVSAHGLTLSKPHHIKLKYPIISRNKDDFYLDGWKHNSKVQAIYQDSWKPRGSLIRHVFRVNTRFGEIGLQLHGNTILAYRIGNHHVRANSPSEATNIITTMIHEGVGIFVREQEQYGNVRLEIGQPEITDKVHYAFVSKLAKKVTDNHENIGENGLMIDKSPQSHGDYDFGEVETIGDEALAAVFDEGIRNAINIHEILDKQKSETLSEVQCSIVENNKTLLDQMHSQINPLIEEVNNAVAILQGGVPLQNQFNQLVGLMSHTLKSMNELQDENKILKEKIAMLESSLNNI